MELPALGLSALFELEYAGGVTRKIRYEIDLSRPTGADVPEATTVRHISMDDLGGLARLMLDAYIGTIDYEGETLEDAMEEVRGFLEDGSSLCDRSFVVEEDGMIVSGVLVSIVQGRPFIGYVMTIPSHKERGLARLVTGVALDRLADDDHDLVALYITEGNTASEALFRSMGAVRVED